MFAIYCGLALHHAKLYDKIRRSEQKYRVALEVLSYHNASSHNEVAQILEDGEPPKDEGISKYVLFYSIYKLVFFSMYEFLLINHHNTYIPMQLLKLFASSNP